MHTPTTYSDDTTHSLTPIWWWGMKDKQKNWMWSCKWESVHGTNHSNSSSGSKKRKVKEKKKQMKTCTKKLFYTTFFFFGVQRTAKQAYIEIGAHTLNVCACAMQCAGVCWLSWVSSICAQQLVFLDIILSVFSSFYKIRFSFIIQRRSDFIYRYIYTYTPTFYSLTTTRLFVFSCCFFRRFLVLNNTTPIAIGHVVLSMYV